MRYRNRVLQFVAITVGVAVVLNLFFELAVQVSAKNGVWIEHKRAKRHLLNRKAPVDVVFIGSSRTQQGIDTALLADAGVSAVNYGVPSGYSGDFAYMVNQAVSVKPKAIVLSIPFQKLSERPTRHTGNYAFEDVRYLLSGNPSLADTLTVLRIAFAQLLPVTRYKSPLISAINARGSTDHWIRFIEREYGVRVDPSSVVFIRGNERRLVSTHVNGDGVTWSRLKKLPKPNDPSKRKISSEKIRLLNRLAVQIREAGVLAVLNLEPGGAYPVCCADLDAINRLLKFDHVLSTFVEFQKPDRLSVEDWADRHHLGVEARRKYTIGLGKELTDILR